MFVVVLVVVDIRVGIVRISKGEVEILVVVVRNKSHVFAVEKVDILEKIVGSGWLNNRRRSHRSVVNLTQKTDTG